MWIIYDLIIHLYGDVISIASLFNPKARRWVKGRKGLFAKIKLAVGQLDSQQSAVGGQQRSGAMSRISRQSSVNDRLTTDDDRLATLAWFHCASLGEFEQGRPVIEALRDEHPDWKILLTFFSPSGYEIRKNYDGADYVFYLPLDSPRNAKKFISMARPSMAIFVKYEFWFRYLDNLHRNNIPVYIISAIFRPEQHFFRWYGGWARKQLRKVTRFFVQDDQSAELLNSFGIEQVTVSGDTRFDRVVSIAAKAKPFPLVEKFADGKLVVLAGSTWLADEDLIMQLIETLSGKVKFIIAPHEVHPARIEALKNSVQSFRSVTFSSLTEQNAETSQVLIVDGIGYLSHLYQYATIAYIGGGFGAGIHNILEAAAFGKPVIFGPKYDKFREAVDLIGAGGAFAINSPEQLNNRATELIKNEDLRQKASDTCLNYVHQKKGATEIILTGIQ